MTKGTSTTEIWGKNDYKRFLKTDIDDADVTFSGTVFHRMM